VPSECRELRVRIPQFEGNLDNPESGEAELADPKFTTKSVVHAIDCVIERRFVPQSARECVLEQIESPEYDDIRELSRFHLAASIPFGDVCEQMRQGRTENVLLMLKKVEPLSAEQIAQFIRAGLGSLEANEIVLAHFLMQSHAESAARLAAALLAADEVDALFHFLAKIVRSRRYWREYHALFSAFDPVLAWASRLITAAFGALTIQRRIEGLSALRCELAEETDRIQAAGACWSIIENIREDKKDKIPPSFMYIVERIQITIPD
jgi:hypothetical protein